jgi:voltage-gated potassium channel
MNMKNPNQPEFLNRLHEIIFESDTRAGRLFDILLLLAIVLSVIVVLLESVHSVHDYSPIFFVSVEWFFTILFSLEYILRLVCIKKPIKYVLSFFGIIDLLSILPTYLSLFVGGAQALMVIRILRLLRIFRIFKLPKFLTQGQMILESLKASKEKIYVFIFSVLLLTFVFGAIMYFIEGKSNPGFDNIPRSIYWCIVTMTTVGYGDISPQTPLGQFLASVLMIFGYAIIAVPTGIVTAEMIKKFRHPSHISGQVCRSCNREGHDHDAEYCKYCGDKL